MGSERILLKRGQFYFIYDGNPQEFVVEDKTKRGLTVVENSLDGDVMADKGRFYDGNGRAHVVPIRWYFPKKNYTFEQTYNFAEAFNSRYKAIMEDTCPDY